MTHTTSLLSTFDPMDIKHQVDQNHDPDQTNSWPVPVELMSQTLTHHALRWELHTLGQALASLCHHHHGGAHALKTRQIKALKECLLEEHLERVVHRFQAEKEHIIPGLQKRFHYPEHQLSEQDDLLDMIATLQNRIASLRVGDTIDQELVLFWAFYQETMTRFLCEKETTVFALVRAYFTAKEVKALETELLFQRSSHQRLDMGALIHFLGAETFRDQFMVQEGISSFLWAASFESKHQLYCSRFVDNVDDLIRTTQGQKQKTKQSCMNRNEAILCR